MDIEEPVLWAPGMTLLTDITPAAWVEQALSATARTGTVASMVPPVFASYARVLQPTYEPDGQGHRWSEIASFQGVTLTAETQFDDLVAGSDRWGRPIDGWFDAPETAALATVLTRFTRTPHRAYFCVWEGLGIAETEAWRDRPMRVRTPGRSYHQLAGPVTAASVLPDPASIWWPDDQAWLVATDIDGYRTYVGGSEPAIAAVLAEPALDAVAAHPASALDRSRG